MAPQVLAALLLIAASLLAGCGGDDPEPAATTDEPVADASDATTTTDEDEPQESEATEAADSAAANSSGDGSAASPELTKAAQEGLTLFLPADQETSEVECSVTDEQKQNGITQYELACTYVVNGVTQVQTLQGVDTGKGPPKVLPVR